MNDAQPVRRRVVEQLDRGERVLQARGVVAEVVVGEREVEVAPRAQRPAVVLLRPAVRRQKGPSRLADVALALAHVRLHEPRPMLEDDVP